MKQQETSFKSLFFKVQPVAKAKPAYAPVQRKIIDVSIYEQGQLTFSSVASVYLYQEKHSMLVEERKQQKQSLLRAERPLLAFPVPRLPRAFVQQIRNQAIREAFLEYLDALPVQLQVKSSQQCEDQPFYQRLDQNQVPNVQAVYPGFPGFYRNLCRLYLSVYGSNDASMDAEAIDGLNFYRFILQVPYVPPFSVWARPVVKVFRYKENNALKAALREVLEVEALQQSLQMALTRRWERDVFGRHIDGEDVECDAGDEHNLAPDGFPDGKDGAPESTEGLGGLPGPTMLLYDLPEDKQFKNSTDLLLSHVFQLSKLLIGCRILPSRFAGTLYSLFLGSQCYSFPEIKYFLVKSDGFLRWLERKNDDLTYAFKAGATAKIFAGIETYTDAGIAVTGKSKPKYSVQADFSVVNSANKQKQASQSIADDESDMLVIDADQHNWDGIHQLLIILTRLLKLKLVNQHGFVLRLRDRGISILNKLLDCQIDSKAQSLATQCIQQLQRLG